MEPVFLGLAEVLEIHRDQIERYGGSPGVRGIGLLRSAVEMPAAGMRGEYFHADLPEMAAAYLFHIVQNHPFVDGNKRTGAMAAFVFLELNGLTLKSSNPAFEKLVLSVAAGDFTKADVTAFFKKRAERKEDPDQP